MHELVQPAYKHTERISFITYEYLSHGVSDRTTSRLRKMESRNVIHLEGNTVGTQYSYNVIQLEFNITYICHVCSRSEAGASQVWPETVSCIGEKNYIIGRLSLYFLATAIDLNSKL
jgi:hypothetical protein